VTWRRQVSAVVVKDVRQRWWMLALLVTVLFVAVLRTTSGPSADDTPFGGADTIVPVLIIWITTGVVRADPPGVPTAFWTTQPLRPSAVAAAKIVQAVLVCLLAGAGAAAILLGRGSGWSEVTSTLLRTLIGIVTFGASGTLLASLGEDWREPVIGALATGLTLFALATLAPEWVRWSTGTMGRLVWAVMLAIAVAAFVRSYIARSMSPRWRMGLAALVTGLCLCALHLREALT
jgi:hypothetical protein